MFPNLVKLAAVAQSLPVTNAWPERGACALKCIKTRLRNSLKDDMLECLLQISINGPPVSECANALSLWPQEKNRRKLPPVTATATASTCTSEGEELQETIITLTEEVDFLHEEV